MWQNITYNAKKYCCEHFLIEAYKYYKGVDLSPKLLTSGFFNVQNLRQFVKVDKPKQYSIVLFRDSNAAHVGLWVDGRVLHLEPHGVVWQPLEYIKRDFERVVFYELSE